MARSPVLFLSHGMPTMALKPGRAGALWEQLGRAIGRPRAIVCISAHLEASHPLLTVDPFPDTIHDFTGFPRVLYGIHYPAPGAPELAHQIISDLRKAGFDAAPLEDRGLDHGAWVPLRNMYPLADVPVIQLSLQTEKPPEYHVALGQALAPLRHRQIMIMASGGATHDLSAMAGNRFGDPVADYARAFDNWLAAVIAKGDVDALTAYRHQGPWAERNHPYPAEHFLPLLVAAGAADDHPAGTCLLRQFAYRVLSLAAYRWD